MREGSRPTLPPPPPTDRPRARTDPPTPHRPSGSRPFTLHPLAAMTAKQRADLLAYVRELTAEGRHAEAAELFALLAA